MNKFMISKQNKTSLILLHVLAWLVLFSIPYFLSLGDFEALPKIMQRVWIPLFFYASLFYINYFILIDKFLFKKKYFIYYLSNIVLIALFVIITIKLKFLFFNEDFSKIPAPNFDSLPPDMYRQHSFPDRIPPSRPESGPRFRMNLFIYFDSLWFVIPLMFSIALKSFERLRKSESQRKEAEKFKLESELKYLKYQLQPHFFFNSLNNIYSLVDNSPEIAKETIHSLGKLMRYLLYETNTELVSLSKEIDFLQKYVQLMKLRSSDKVLINYNFPEVKEIIKVAPLLYISLIENAFKHGVSATENTEVEFAITVDDKNIYFKSTNSHYPKGESDKSGAGIGLENLEKRLSLLYDDEYTFESKIENNYFIVSLTLPIK